MNSNNTHYTGTCVSMDAFAEFLSRQKALPPDLPVLNIPGADPAAGFTFRP